MKEKKKKSKKNKVVSPEVLEKPKRDQKKERRKRKALYRKYGHLMIGNKEDIPPKHRTKLGSLRCFRKIPKRDEHGNKLWNEPKRRCGSACTKHSLYCQRHGGANANNLVSGKRTTSVLDQYKGVVTAGLGEWIEKFASDKGITDLSREIAVIRTLMLNYINAITLGTSDDRSNVEKLEFIQMIMGAADMSTGQKLTAIKEVVETTRRLDDGQVIDRIMRCVDSIGKTVERMNKIQQQDEFVLTPDGFRLLMRGLISVLKRHLDEDQRTLIQASLQDINVRTGGDLKNLSEPSTIEASFSYTE